MADDAGKGKKKGEFFTVFDLNAKPGEARTHEIITEMRNGQVVSTQHYSLYSDRGCEMPEDHALKFLRDNSFAVVDKTGARVEPVEVKDLTSPKMRLEENEVIARMDELTREALLKRAKIMPGSEELKASDDKETIIGFLVGKAREKLNVGVSRGSESATAEMSADELDNLIEGKK